LKRCETPKDKWVSHMSIIDLQTRDNDGPLVASPNQAMQKLLVSRSKLYELINTGELESYTEGRSRRITFESINAYVKRRLEAEAARRGRAA
jgi:excisionase family DNA binding protein